MSIFNILNLSLFQHTMHANRNCIQIYIIICVKLKSSILVNINKNKTDNTSSMAYTDSLNKYCIQTLCLLALSIFRLSKMIAIDVFMLAKDIAPKLIWLK